jgi:GTP-binding protein
MFKDEHTICLRSGNGGDGITAFRREKCAPRGGPNGGDGGRGGSVSLRASHQLATFSDMMDQVHYRAKHGEPGEGSTKTGKSADDIVIDVPIGTLVFNRQEGSLMKDLDTEGDTILVLTGGAGGRGNNYFKTATNQVPMQSTKGEKGSELWLRFELKLLADVGLVGLPNAGKSTLLSRLSRARPKIASYPFTTLAPFLGIVAGEGFRSFTLADLPGLIEGAADGHGLGHQFLRHVERTRALVHVVDLFGDDPAAAYLTIRKELEKYGHDLINRPEIVAANKIDQGECTEALSRLREVVDTEIVPISGVSGRGLPYLVEAILKLL